MLVIETVRSSRILDVNSESYPPRSITSKDLIAQQDVYGLSDSEFVEELGIVNPIGFYQKLIFVLKLLKRWLILLIIFPLLCGTAAWAYSNYYVVPLFAAKSTLLVQPQNISSQNMYNSIMGNQQLIKTYEGLIKTRTIALDVSRRLDNKVTPERVLENLGVKTSNVTFLITLTYTDTNQERAVRVVNEVARSFAKNVGVFVNLDNVMIVDEAVPQKDASPVSPQIVTNTLLGFALGLLLCILLVVVVEALKGLMKLLQDAERNFKAEGRRM